MSNTPSEEASSRPSPIQLVDDLKARNKASATRPLERGEVIAVFAPLSLALLPSQKGIRCDFCLALPSKSRKLGKCSGCAAYWYCGPECQKEAWSSHHKNICKTFATYEASSEYSCLADDQKADAVLLSHLVAEIALKSLSSVDSMTEDVSSPSSEPFMFTTFLSLLGHDNHPAPPPVACRPAQNSPSPSELYSRFGRNNFVVHSHLSPIAHGIFPVASRLFNHSCTPNAAAKYIFGRDKAGVRMVVVALRNISHNEEITIPYLDPALPFLERQLSLEQNYGFRCTCHACSFGSQLATNPNYTGDAPREEDILTVGDTLLNHTGLSLSLPASDVTQALNVVRNMHAIPETLYPLLHKSIMPRISEEFSQASHEGAVDRATDVGHVLLAVYVLVYPPGYPQIGMHALELAKTAYNGVITRTQESSALDNSAKEEELLRRAGWYLAVAKHILLIFGPEGDVDGGPLEEAEFLHVLIEEELNSL